MRPEAESGGSARLDVGGVVYEFTPSTCTITDGDFVAAGSGEIGGETFWVSASTDELNLAVGTTNEFDRPADDAVWLSSVEGIDWTSQGPGLQAASAHAGRSPGRFGAHAGPALADLRSLTRPGPTSGSVLPTGGSRRNWWRGPGALDDHFRHLVPRPGTNDHLKQRTGNAPICRG